MVDETTENTEEELPGEEEELQVNPLSVSDEDIENMPLPEDPSEVTEDKSDEEEEELSSEEDPEMDITEPEDDDDSTDKKADDLDPDMFADDSAEQTGEKGTKKKKSAAAAEDTGDATSVTINYEQEYKRILAPFRANGRDMTVSSIDDAINLMKMGANYNKKMAGLKPNLRLLKMLENNGLLDETKLNYLIDLDKKDPGAVGKLVKDSGIDPLEINTEEDTEYTPKTYSVDDNEVELDNVLDDIRDTDAFSNTINIISNKWDEASKRILYDNPNIIKTINEHVSLGIYDQIAGIMENERMMGRMTELSDLAAYKKIGDALQANGAFNDTVPNDATAAPSKPKEDPKLKSRKKAASSTKATPSKSKALGDYNPLALSDEEFEKIASSQYM